MHPKSIRLAAALIPWAVCSAAAQVPVIPEPPSPARAVYIEPSAARELQPGEKIENLYTRNVRDRYVLQKLTERTYWVERQFYATIFYVGEEGVLLFDPLDGHGQFLQQAIAEVTSLPVTAVVYSHNHADHIGDAKVFSDAAASAGVKKFRIIASERTADNQRFLKSAMLPATERVNWPRGSFKFEELKVELHGLERASHADDHGAWLLDGQGVVHLPDHINPDQPPFWAFAGSENFVYFEPSMRELESLRWTFLSGGHGNVGSRSDLDFYRTFIGDLKQAVGRAMQDTQFGAGVDPGNATSHAGLLPAWLAAVAEAATAALRPKYGRLYGFEESTPRNAEMVAIALYSYR